MDFSKEVTGKLGGKLSRMMGGNKSKVVEFTKIANDTAEAVGAKEHMEIAEEAVAGHFQDLAPEGEDGTEPVGDEDADDEEPCSDQIEDAMAEKAGEDAALNAATLVAEIEDEKYGNEELSNRFAGIEQQLAALAQRVRVLESS